MTADGSPTRIPALEGLRGVASSVVVLRHTTNTLEFPLYLRRELAESPLAIFLNSDGAVEVFFVLSGFVLAGSVLRHGYGLGALAFYVKRIFRVHVPYLAAVVLAWLVSFFYVVLPEGNGVTAWGRSYATIHLGFEELLTTFVFPSSARGQLPVGWTLSWEMLFSLLAPLLVLAARRVHWGVILLAALILPVTVRGFASAWLGVAFVLGIVLFQEHDRLGRLISGWKPAVTVPIVIAVLFVFCGPMLFGRSHFFQDIPSYGLSFQSIVIMAFGSAGIVAATLHVGWMQAWLSTRPVLYLGRISYSLYLVHMTVVLFIAPWIVGTPNTWMHALALIGLTFGISIAVSHVFHRFVEQPSIFGGAVLGRLLFRR